MAARLDKPAVTRLAATTRLEARPRLNDGRVITYNNNLSTCTMQARIGRGDAVSSQQHCV